MATKRVRLSEEHTNPEIIPRVTKRTNPELSNLPTEIIQTLACYLSLHDVASFRLVVRFNLHPIVWSRVLKVLEKRLHIESLNTQFKWWGIPWITLGPFMRGDMLNILHVNHETTTLPYIPNQGHLLRQGEYPHEPEYYQYPGSLGFLRLTHIPTLSCIDKDGFTTPP
jgi:hypothetical protein